MMEMCKTLGGHWAMNWGQRWHTKICQEEMCLDLVALLWLISWPVLCAYIGKLTILKGLKDYMPEGFHMHCSAQYTPVDASLKEKIRLLTKEFPEKLVLS